MQFKDSKKSKFINHQNNNISSNNKHLEENYSINKLISKNKNTRIITDNNNNSNINRTKTHEAKINISQNKITKKNTNLEKEKKNKSIHIPLNSQGKTGVEKKSPKISTFAKQKTPNKINIFEKSRKSKVTKKTTSLYNSKKKPFLKSKTSQEIITSDKRRKSDNINLKHKTEKKQKLNKIDEKETGFNTKKLLEFLISLSPIDTSKCDDLISNNMNKIIELENKISEISKTTQYEINKITNNENNKDNKITTKQNLEIINIESKMRKDIYKLFFNFITDLLEQINKLSNNIAGQEINDLNLRDNTFSSNDLFANNNSENSNNSLFASNIEEEFCERLINITKSFISSDIDLIDLKSNFELDEIKKNDLFINEEDKDIDYKNKNKKIFMIHPNEILDKIQKEEKKDKKVIHHYSNSLRVNSNLEKLEGKKNDDNDKMIKMNSGAIGNFSNLEKLKNCNIF